MGGHDGGEVATEMAAQTALGAAKMVLDTGRHPAALKDGVLEHGFVLGSGYGPLKPTTFRIGHMGEHDMNDLTDLLQRFDAAMNAEVQA